MSNEDYDRIYNIYINYNDNALLQIIKDSNQYNKNIIDIVNSILKERDIPKSSLNKETDSELLRKIRSKIDKIETPLLFNLLLIQCTILTFIFIVIEIVNFLKYDYTNYPLTIKDKVFHYNLFTTFLDILFSIFTIYVGINLIYTSSKSSIKKLYIVLWGRLLLNIFSTYMLPNYFGIVLINNNKNFLIERLLSAFFWTLFLMKSKYVMYCYEDDISKFKITDFDDHNQIKRSVLIERGKVIPFKIKISKFLEDCFDYIFKRNKKEKNITDISITKNHNQCNIYNTINLENINSEDKNKYENKETEFNKIANILSGKNIQSNIIDIDKFSTYLNKCESEPEILLLIEMINKFKLNIINNILIGSFKVDVQYKIGNYRADFLINNKYIVEVDGRSYHENDNSFHKDRLRDQNLMMKGYITIRFTAAQIYESQESVVNKIQKIILKSENDD